MKNLDLTFTFYPEEQVVNVFQGDHFLQSVEINSKGVINSNDFNRLTNALHLSLEDEKEDLNFEIFRCWNEAKAS